MINENADDTDDHGFNLKIWKFENEHQDTDFRGSSSMTQDFHGSKPRRGVI